MAVVDGGAQSIHVSDPVSAETVTLFRMHSWRDVIQRVPVVRQSACFVVWIDADWNNNERKERREGQFFDTWEAAHAALLERATKAVESSKEILQKKRTALGMVEAMKP